MTAGKLASVKPAATTNTFLYRAPITTATSAVLNVVNQSGSGATYRAALRDYDQVLTLDASSYKYRKGNVVCSCFECNMLKGVLPPFFFMKHRIEIKKAIELETEIFQIDKPEYYLIKP